MGQQEHRVALAVEAALEGFGFATLRVVGRSMWPTLWPGAQVTVRRTPADRLAPGDLVLYRRGHSLVLHRIVGTKGSDQLLVRGDRTRVLEEALARSDVLARAPGLSLGRWTWSGCPAAPARLVGRLSSRVAPLSRARGPLRSLARLSHRVGRPRPTEAAPHGETADEITFGDA